MLAFIFQVSSPTVHRVLDRMLDVFFDHYKTQINERSLKFREQNGVRFYDKLVTIVLDGTEQQVFTPSDKKKEQSLYSGKKRKHTFTLLIGVSPRGYILFVSLSYNGSNNDLNLVDFPENHIWEFMDSSENIIADKGFRGLTRGFLPFIGDDAQLTDREKDFNKKLASVRIVVENAISHIKKWKICTHPFRSSVSDIEYSKVIHNKIWVVCAGLVNEFVMPIREANNVQ